MRRPIQGALFEVGRAAAAVTFALAAILKLEDQLWGRYVSDVTRLLLSIGWIGLEWFLAFWLASGLRARLAGYVTAACLATLAGVNIWNWLHGATDCGCFGRWHVHPLSTAAMDLVLAAALTLGTPASKGLRPGWFRTAYATLAGGGLALTLIVALMAGLEARHVCGPSVVVSSWDHVTPGTPMDRIAWLAPVDPPWPQGGRWLLVFADPYCWRCRLVLQELLQQWDQWEGEHPGLQLAIVRVARPRPIRRFPHQDQPWEFPAEVPQFQMAQRLDASGELVIPPLPSVVLVENGRFILAAESVEELRRAMQESSFR